MTKDINIVLDTNLFGEPTAHNFKYTSELGRSLQELSSYANIHIFIPSEVKNELEFHIKKVISDFKKSASESKYIKEINTYFFNIDILNEIYDKVLKENYKKLEDFINKYKIEIIDCDKYLNISEINKWYFNDELPFEEKEAKKSEFPDAMIISSVKNFFQNNDSSVYVVSKDKGFRKAFIKHCDNFRTFETISGVMNEIIGYTITDLNLVTAYLNDNKPSIISNLKLDFVLENIDYDECDMEIDKIKINDSSILSKENEQIDVLLDCQISFSGYARMMDPYESFYDKEDNEYIYITFKETSKIEADNLQIVLTLEKKSEKNYKIIDAELLERLFLIDYSDQMEEIYDEYIEGN